jgi:antitoxin ParD1/3/4
MNITLTPDIQERISQKIRTGEFQSEDDLIQQALQCFLDMNGEELEETKAAIEEALEQSRRGEGIPAEEVFQELRAKYGIPR